jgi:predicted Zn-dependent peptidase
MYRFFRTAANRWTMAGMMKRVFPATLALAAIGGAKFTLPNGLHVILHRDQDRCRPAAVNVWYHVGSGSEKPGRTGFAHLFEHLMFEGSEHVPKGPSTSWLEAAGGNNNGSTSVTAPTTSSTCRATRSSSRCSSSRIAWATCSTR